MILRNLLGQCFLIISLQAVLITVENKTADTLNVFPIMHTDSNSFIIKKIATREIITVGARHIYAVSGFIKTFNKNKKISVETDRENMKIIITSTETMHA